MSRSQDDVETLRILLNLPREVLLDDFEPAPVPTGIKSFLRRATRHQLQGLLIEVLHRLRTSRRARPGSGGSLGGDD